MNNQQAVINYYQKHRDEIVDFIAVRIQDREEAKDIVQNLFLRLFQGPRLITEQSLPALVYTLARHFVADYFRRRHVFEEYEHYIRRSDIADNSMESVFSVRQIMERMEHSLARLPESCKEVYRLHIYEGMKVGEISQACGKDYKRVEYHLGVARKVVRQYLRACV